MIDYAESIEKIAKLRRQAHDALLHHEWKTACDCADEIVVCARAVKIFSMEQLDTELGQTDAYSHS
jgi:hypothetical protein